MKNLLSFVTNKAVCFLVLVLLGALAYYCKKTFQLPVLYYSLLVIITATITCVVLIIGQLTFVEKITKALSDSSQLPRYLLATAALLYLLVFTSLSICRHDAFATRMYDFGNMDQALWNASQGRGLENTSQLFPFENKTRLANHVEPIFFALALIYRALPSTSLLFFIQTACIVLEMVFLYFIALQCLGSRWKALCTAIVYALYPTVQHMNLFEFHADVLAVPALMAAFLAYEKKRHVFFWVCIVAALACKEYAGLAAGGMGIGLLLFKKNMRVGLPLMVTGFGYFLVCVLAINPFFNSGRQSDIVGILYPGIGGQAGVGGILHSMLSHPLEFGGKILNNANAEGLFYVLFPLAFIPLAAPLLAIAILPVIAKDLLIGVDVGVHRLACLLPMLFVSFVYGMKKIETLFSKRIAKADVRPVWIFVLSASLLATWAYGPSPLGHRFWAERYKYIKSPRMSLYREFLSQVPDSVAISVDDCFAPHLTHRRFCYIFPQPFSPQSEAAGRVSVVLIDTLAKDVQKCNCDPCKLVKSRGFVISRERDGIFLFTRSPVAFGH
jgi:uncharacterized membrane protein